MPNALPRGEAVTLADAERPFPNEAACRIREPGAFQADSFRRVTRKHEGKTYSIIMGRLKGQETLTEQAYRYPKSSWTEAQARSHCASHGGKSFEPASGEKALGEQRIELPVFHRAGTFSPSTVNEDTREIELCWTTGAVVRRRGFFMDEDWDEELSLSDESVRLDRLNNGANLLDSHVANRLSNVLGVVERAWLQGNGKSREGRAIVRFSERPDVEPFWHDVRTGIIRNVSVGYKTNRVTKTERRNNVPLVLLTDWEPTELSLVAVPADAKAQVRSDQDFDDRLYPCIVRGVTTMARQATSQAEATDEAARAALTEDQDQDVNERQDDHEDGEDHEEESRQKPAKKPRGQGKVQRILDDVDEENERKRQRAERANGKVNGAEPAPQPQGISEDEVNKRVQDALKAEADRRQKIAQTCRVLKIETEVGDQLIAQGVSAEDAWRELLAELERRENARSIVRRAPAQVTSGEQDEETVRYRSIASALLHRFNPGAFQMELRANEYMGFSLLEIARHCLESAGVRTVGMNKQDLADKALLPGYGVRAGPIGYHTTSDFSVVLADVVNKTLRQAYTETPRTYLPIARRATAPDFKVIQRTQMGELGNLSVVAEHGEYKRVSMSDAKEAYSLATYGAVFAVTRKVIINDDLDAFTRIPQKFGASAARTESDIVWGVITANAAMGDGTPLFHANHGNLKASGSTVPNVTTVGLGRAAMRVQRGLDAALINVQPRFLVVPAALETVAEQFLSGQLLPATTATVVPESMRASLTLIVEPRLDANSTTAWYLFASPADIDTLEYAFLEGSDGVSISTRNGFDIDGVEIKASLDFAAKAIDWRGIYKDVGAP